MTELSAMERDIMLCTGCIPEKIRKLALNIKFEGMTATNFLSLVKLEASKLIGVNTSLIVRKEQEALVIGRNSIFNIAFDIIPMSPT